MLQVSLSLWSRKATDFRMQSLFCRENPTFFAEA